MDIDARQVLPDCPPAIHRLMRLMAHLNIGATLALCLWLGWAAMDYTERSRQGTAVGDCGCNLTEVTDWSGRIDIASSHQLSN